MAEVIENTQAKSPVESIPTVQPKTEETKVPFSFTKAFNEGDFSKTVSKTSSPEEPPESQPTPPSAAQPTVPPVSVPAKKFMDEFENEEDARKVLEQLRKSNQELDKKNKELDEHNTILRENFPTVYPPAQTSAQPVSQPSTASVTPPASEIDKIIEQKSKEISKWTPDEIDLYNNPETHHQAVEQHEERMNREILKLNQQYIDYKEQQRQNKIEAKNNLDKTMNQFFKDNPDMKFFDNEEGRSDLINAVPRVAKLLNSADLVVLKNKPAELWKKVSAVLVEDLQRKVQAMAGNNGNASPAPVKPTPPANEPNSLIQPGSRPALSVPDPKKNRVKMIVSLANNGRVN